MKRKLLIIIGIIVFVGLIVLLNLTQKEGGEEVETARASYQSIVSRVSGDGNIKAKVQVNIQAEVMARIERLLVKEGDWVKKGSLLCLLDSKSYEAQLSLAEARYQKTWASFVRAETLFDKKLISQEEYERAETEYKVARASFAEASDRYEKTKIRSPISGRVVKLNVEEGEMVVIGTMNSPGTVLMVIADLQTMLAKIELSEADVVDVKIGDPCEVELNALPDRKFRGVVTEVGYMPIQPALATEEKTPSFEITIELRDTSSLLRPGMSCHAEIETYRRDSVLVVPIQAVGKRKINGEERDAVFVVEGKRAKLVPVKTGKSGDAEIEILEGLKEQDEVITGPYRVLARLKEGARVLVKREEKEKRPGTQP